VLRILSLSDLKPLEIDSPRIRFGLRWGNFPLVLRSRLQVEVESGSGGGAWATGSVWPSRRSTRLARWPGVRRRANSGNGHWANNDGLEQAETRSGPG
jgi:hypothetical protein